MPSALASLEALLRLVDDVNAALAADKLVVAMASAQGFQRVANLHRTGLRAAWSDNRTGLSPKSQQNAEPGSWREPGAWRHQSTSHNPAGRFTQPEPTSSAARRDRRWP